MNTPTSPYITRTNRDHLSFFHDNRSGKLQDIETFLESPAIEKLQNGITENAYIALGGDGTFIDIAKLAHRDQTPILGVNFGSKGFLLHDQKSLDRDDLLFDFIEYPLLHADIEIEGVPSLHGHAFNEVYITRSGRTGSLRLSISHRAKKIPSYTGDGLMISTPAGSTGWSRSYGGMILPHDANMNIVTPIGKMSPKDFQSHPLPDKGRIRIENDTTRESPLDILVDNVPIVERESRKLNITIERASRGVQLLIARGYRDEWDAKSYRELGYMDL